MRGLEPASFQGLITLIERAKRHSQRLGTELPDQLNRRHHIRRITDEWKQGWSVDDPSTSNVTIIKKKAIAQYFLVTCLWIVHCMVLYPLCRQACKRERVNERTSECVSK